MDWRLIDSDLSEPAFTAAADEAIARARSENRVPNTLHFYRRKRPTISLGYFQEVEKSVDLKFCNNNGIEIIRRATGGSAIYTDPGHLIYGIAVDGGSMPGDRNGAFRKVCGAIVLALGELGIEAKFKLVNDVLVNGRKISGSAQMRRWGIVLQHGTVVMDSDGKMLSGALRQDREKIASRGQTPETYVTSIREELGVQSNPSELKGAIARAFEEVFGMRLRESSLTGYETELISQLIEEKYGRDGWTFKR